MLIFTLYTLRLQFICIQNPTFSTISFPFLKVINRVLKNNLKVFVDLCGELWGIV